MEVEPPRDPGPIDEGAVQFEAEGWCNQHKSEKLIERHSLSLPDHHVPARAPFRLHVDFVALGIDPGRSSLDLRNRPYGVGMAISEETVRLLKYPRKTIRWRPQRRAFHAQPSWRIIASDPAATV